MRLLRGTVRLAQRQHCQKASNPRTRKTVPALILIQRSHYCTVPAQNLRPRCPQPQFCLPSTTCTGQKQGRDDATKRPSPEYTSRTARYVLVACILGGVLAELSDPCGSR
jgi:hypothetical protein